MRRLRIDRINLRLRNVSAATAQDAARLLGPALSRALAAGQSLKATPTDPVGTAPGADGLATSIAARIAAQVRRG